MPQDNEGVVEFAKFSGLRNNLAPEAFDPGDLVSALNIDLDDKGEARRRSGYGSAVVSGSTHSLWSDGSTCFAVRNGDLVAVDSDWTTQLLRAGIGDLPVSYVALGDRVFYSNGTVNGVVQKGRARSWGLAVPDVPEAQVVGGGLLPGRYQYALTFVRDDGQESGASHSGIVELTAATGIGLDEIDVSLDPTVVAKWIYLSEPNGELLYRHTTLTNAETTALLHASGPCLLPLRAQFLKPPPPARILGVHHGRVLLVRGDTLYYSEAFAPELYDLRKSYAFEAAITIVAPAGGGVFCGTDSSIFYLAGSDAEAFGIQMLADYGAIPGTLSYIPAQWLDDGSENDIAIWHSKRGVCVGFPGGVMKNLSESRFAFPQQERGASVVRLHRGVMQFVSTLQGIEVPGDGF